ncbi:MAG: CAF17-like 4Fe-4S cluster assembly/insertion protein YgfZ [Acidiferrobacter sp.]
MLREWKTELIEAGGVEDHDAILHYGNPQAEVVAAANTTVSCALTHIAIIKASGADAASFLQGQFSNDILTLGNTNQLSAYCTAQGRMITLFRIVRCGDAFFLLLPRDLLVPTLKRLTMYILRAKVTLNAADDWALLGLSGPASPDILKQVPLPVPSAVPEVLTQDALTVLAIPGLAPRYLLLGPEEAVRAVVMPKEVPTVGSQAWAWLDIQAGLPTIGAATSEAFVPQMVNLDLLNGINFRKGCYPGQEIVARTHYLGRLKQRMYLASLPPGHIAPTPGTALSAPNFPGQPAGTIVDAQIGPHGAIDLLAVVQISSHDEGTVFLQDTPLTFRDLPYPLAASC